MEKEVTIPHSGLRTLCRDRLRNARETYIVTIPHGGLRTHEGKEKSKNWLGVDVTIPHSGLRTVAMRKLIGFIDWSPSHTVGLER
ncbi:hypothetical protein [Thermocrinis sp.]|uniref:hypothetical protein n=1 Tax=Thermocrinis sp. TaxID=2024383 RepID=UPI003C0027C4